MVEKGPNNNELIRDDEHCRSECLCLILHKLLGENSDVEGKKFVRNTIETLKILQGHRLDFVVFVPAYGWLFPFAWRILIEFPRQVCRSKMKLAAFASQFRRAAFLYHLTPYQLYGVPDVWTHCVCELFLDAGDYIYHDGYKNHLASNDQLQASPVLTHEDLLKKWGIIICTGTLNKLG